MNTPDILALKLNIIFFVLVIIKKHTSDNIKIEKPNHRLITLAIKLINSSICILADCVYLVFGEMGGNICMK